MIREDHELLIRVNNRVVSQREAYSHHHGSRVRFIASNFAREVGMSPAEIELIEVGASLHDIGKVSVPEQIVNKIGKLTPMEYIVMQQHTALGYYLGIEAQLGDEINDMIRHHHERWDGEGYPDRIKAHEISTGAAIIHITDTFDALTEQRSYHPARSTENAIHIMQADHGGYHPELLKIFMENIERWTEPH